MKILLKIFIVVQGMTLTQPNIREGIEKLRLPFKVEVEINDLNNITEENRAGFYYDLATCTWGHRVCLFVLPPVDGYKFGGLSHGCSNFSNVYYAPGYDRVNLLILLSEFVKAMGCTDKDEISICAKNARNLDYVLTKKDLRQIRKCSL